MAAPALLITELAQIVGSLCSPLLLEFTREFNKVPGKTQVDFWMDAAKGVGHRVVHGHSLDNMTVILDKFGWEGLIDYFTHLSRDLMSPHGIPIPFAKEVAEGLGLRSLQAVEWLCFNVGDVLAFVPSVAHSIQLKAMVRASAEQGALDHKSVILILVSIAHKIWLGLITNNPFTLVVSIVDLGVVVWGVGASVNSTHQPALFSSPKFISDKMNFYETLSGKSRVHSKSKFRPNLWISEIIDKVVSISPRKQFEMIEERTIRLSKSNCSAADNFFPAFFSEAYC